MEPNGIAAPTLDQIRAARRRLHGIAVETPLLRLNWEPPGEDAPEIYLKLENLQPIGSFKLRGAVNAMLEAGAERLAEGVYTASAGNMAQGVAWGARHLGATATAIVPDHAPATKIAAIERLGGRVVKVPFERWWQVIVEHSYPGQPGLFIHPVSATAVMAGNGTIGLEILDRLPDVDAVLVPWGGGGLACGIAAGLRELRPRAAVYGCEITTAAPLTAALAAGALQAIDYQPSFVDGIGGKSLLPEMWPLAQRLIAGSRVVSLAAVAAAVRHLAERHRVIAEGAGAAALAVALSAPPDIADATALAAVLAATSKSAGAGAVTAPAGIADAEGKPARKIVCIVSGGNIDTAKLVTILGGGVP